MKKILSVAALASLTPIFAFAACTASANGSITDLCTLILKINDLVNSAVWVFISLAVVFIVWNGVQFIMKAASDDRKAYQNAMMWGIVGLAVILSIWGLVNILRNTLFVDNTNGSAAAQGSINSLILHQP